MLGEFKRLLRGIQLKVAWQNWNLRFNQVPVRAALTLISTPGSTSWQCSFTYQSQMPLFGSMGLGWHLFSSMWSRWQLQVPPLRPHVHLLVEVDCCFSRSLRRCRRFCSSCMHRALKACVASNRAPSQMVYSQSIISMHSTCARWGPLLACRRDCRRQNLCQK